MKASGESSEGAAIIATGAVIALTPFAIDAYLPALPLMSQRLHASVGEMQATITAYLLGLALGPLLLGPLSDRVGRRGIILGCLAVFCVTSALCALTTSAAQLIGLRFLQAVAGGGAAVAAQSMLSDRFKGADLARANSLALLTLTIAPVVAPFIGAEIAARAGWRAIFACLAILGCGAAALVLILRESRPAKGERTRPARPALATYVAILSRAEARALVGALASTAVAFFAFIAASPFLFMSEYGWSERGYALSLLAMAVLAAAFNVVSASIVRNVGAAAILRVCTLGVALVGLWTMGCALTRWGGAFSVFAGTVWMMTLLHLIGANATARLLDLFPDGRGAAAALAAAARFVAGALGALAVAWLNGGAWALGLVIACAGAAAWAGVRALRAPSRGA